MANKTRLTGQRIVSCHHRSRECRTSLTSWCFHSEPDCVILEYSSTIYNMHIGFNIFTMLLPWQDLLIFLNVCSPFSGLATGLIFITIGSFNETKTWVERETNGAHLPLNSWPLPIIFTPLPVDLGNTFPTVLLLLLMTSHFLQSINQRFLTSYSCICLHLDMAGHFPA